MIITKETDYAMRILRVLLDGEKQHPQNAHRVVRLFGDDHAPHPLFACLLVPSYQS